MNTANNLIYLIVSALLSVMAVSGVFGRANLSRLEVLVEFPAEIFAGKTIPVKVTLRNHRRFLPAFLIRVLMDDREFLFALVETRQESTKYVDYSCPVRGRHRIPDVHLCSVFPFNFFIRCKNTGHACEYVVFPEPRRCHLADQLERRHEHRGEQSSRGLGYDGDFLAVRDYLNGDPLKYINWKASARTNRLKTKQFASQLAQPVMLDFARIDIKGLEEKLACLTYVINRLYKNNVPFGLRFKHKIYGIDLSYSHKLNLLTELGLYAQD